MLCHDILLYPYRTECVTFTNILQHKDNHIFYALRISYISKVGFCALCKCTRQCWYCKFPEIYFYVKLLEIRVGENMREPYIRAFLTAVLWLFFPLMASIINKTHGSLHLLIAAATVIWHRRLRGLAFTQKTGRTFLFLILVNLFAISRCQTDARAKSISFTQEWLGHARVNHSRFIISAAADAFLVRQLRDVGVDRLKGQVQLERSSRLSCNNFLQILN